MVTVGQRVREARKARGLGVNELDARIGSTQGYVSRLENSTRDPRASTLRALAEALAVNVLWLTSGEGPRDKGSAPTLPEPVYERDDERYPNRTIALRLMGAALDPRARDALLSYRLSSNNDLTLDQWVEEATSLHRKAKRIDREFAAVARDDGSIDYEPVSDEAKRTHKRVGTMVDVRRNVAKRLAAKPGSGN